MEVYYKFKSAKVYDSISIDWHYTTVSDVKQYVLQKKCSGKRNKAHYDNLFLTNAVTNQEYVDGQTLIPQNTSIIIRRAPRSSYMPIVINPPVQNKLEEEGVRADENSFDEPSISVYPPESEWIEFWNDLAPSKILVPVLQDAISSEADEDSKIRDLIDTPALEFQQCHNPAGRGFGRGGIAVRSGGRGFGQGGLYDPMTPLPGYICHRCKVPGHFIQRCPTNGDPAFDVKRTKPPRGIPSSMLMACPDGSYALPGSAGAVAVLKPNEAAIAKEVQAMPSTRSVANLPAELYCPLCRAVMREAVLASKCCFKSFCDKCIRDYIVSKSLCVCGATNVLADYLIPNKTLRDTIIRFLQSTNSRGADSGSAFQLQDTESARCPQPKITCPEFSLTRLSADSKEVVLASKSEGNTKDEKMTEPVEVDNITQKTSGKMTVGKGAEVAHECVREPGTQTCLLVTDKEKEKKLVSMEAGREEKIYADMHMRTHRHQDLAAENYLMPVDSSGHDPYWNGMQPKFDGFGRPNCGPIPSMVYGLGTASIPFWGAFHHNPFGAQVYKMAIPSQGDLGEFGKGFNGGSIPPVMSSEEFEARKTTIKQKPYLERSRGGMEVSRDRDISKDMMSHKGVPYVESKFKSIAPPYYHHPRPRLESPSPERDPEVLRTSSKRKVKHDDDYYEEHPHHQSQKKERLHHHQSGSELESTTSSLIIPDTVEKESAVLKKRKLDNSSSPPPFNGSCYRRSHSTKSNQCKSAATVSKNIYKYADERDFELSDNDRNFKRRPRYESSPAPVVVKGRHSSRGWREKRMIAASTSRLSVY